ncbi:hypothetical protein C6A85_12590, partial [Mycobacterium sp. ITM-2017-0098]
ALLIVIMLLGHWVEMRSLAQTTSALDSLAALLPDEAEKIDGDGQTDEQHHSRFAGTYFADRTREKGATAHDVHDRAQQWRD